MELRPQPGPQEQALASSADILVYGGAAGGGKSFGLLLESIRHMANPKFGGVIFRRTSPQLEGAGSLWEEAKGIYSCLGAKMSKHPTLRATFPEGGMLQFLHLQYADDVEDHQGKQYAFVGFDELTHFEESQFWYLVTRMRSTSGITPYMRCTTNPDPDSFVRKLIDWWIGDDGYPIKKRSGIVRWMSRPQSEIIWADSREEMVERLTALGTEGKKQFIQSFTFIAAELADNPALTKADPQYEARLGIVSPTQRERLLYGNWDIREGAGEYIEAPWMANVWHAPPSTDGLDGQELLAKLPPLNIYTASDYAVAEKRSKGHEPDYTEHGVFGFDADDNLWVLDWYYGQTTSAVWIDTAIDLWLKWKPMGAFGEGGGIAQAVKPALIQRMRERRCFTSLHWINAPQGQPNAGKQGFADASKRAKARKARAFQARAQLGKILTHPNADWMPRLREQCVGFPAASFDDGFDCFALMCMAIDQAHHAVALPDRREKPRDRWADKPKLAKSWRVA